MMELEDIGMIE